MRVIWGLILLTSSTTFALSTAKFAQNLTEKLLDANNTDSNLAAQCSQFVKSCLDLCEGDGISSFASTCSARNATCQCNDIDLSATVFTKILQYSIQGIGSDKKKLEVETNRTLTHVSSVKAPITYNNFLLSEEKGELKQQQQDKRDIGMMEEGKEDVVKVVEEEHINAAAIEAEQEAEQETMDGEELLEEEVVAVQDNKEKSPVFKQQQPQPPAHVLEFIYPQTQVVKTVPFQQRFCAQYSLRCKQDCPAAYSSALCNINTETTGFLLSCVCNGVDISTSILTQVKAESKRM